MRLVHPINMVHIPLGLPNFLTSILSSACPATAPYVQDSPLNAHTRYPAPVLSVSDRFALHAFSSLSVSKTT